MKNLSAILALILVGTGSVAGCSDNQGVNAGTGALVGAAVGN